MGGKFGMKKKAPKNKKITFDDDEPAEKKVKGTCSKTFFRTNAFEGIFGAMEDRTSSVYLLQRFFSFSTNLVLTRYGFRSKLELKLKTNSSSSINRTDRSGGYKSYRTILQV